MENKNLIKVLNQDKANQLIIKGFKYITETVNENQTIYSFFVSEELLSYVNKNFDKRDFFLSNKMTFS